MMNHWQTALGIMSGTSLDGVDLALCSFKYNDEKWEYKIIDATTLPYSDEWKMKIQKAHQLSAYEFQLLHNEYGRYLGTLCNQFLKNQNIQPILIASHGHTIFHNPDLGLTFQLGHGVEIAAITEIDTISDFRVNDVALGGQGAPLVPIGDELLFNNFDFCLNFGGIANISTKINGKRVAWDICVANMAFNYISNQLGFEYDDKGQLAKQGKSVKQLLEQLNALPFFELSAPKSLGREFFEMQMKPLLDECNASPYDKLHTLVQHTAHQIAKNIHEKNVTILCTGGGAHNSFLIETLGKLSKNKWILPDNKTINFKEALIFGFLGILRLNNQINCLQSVTGAKKDTCCGIIYKS